MQCSLFTFSFAALFNSFVPEMSALPPHSAVFCKMRVYVHVCAHVFMGVYMFLKKCCEPALQLLKETQ